MFSHPSRSVFRRCIPLLLMALVSAVRPVAFAQDQKPTLYGNIIHVDVKGNVHTSALDIIQKLVGKSGTSLIGVGKGDAPSLNVAAVQGMGVFSSVQVTTDRDPLGGTDVTCTVIENPVVKAIKFIANTSDGKPTIPEATLLAHMHLIMGQVLNTNTLSSDLEALCDHDTGYLRSLGYICDYNHDTATDSATGVLTITLIEGFIDKVEVLGNGSVPATTVRNALQIKSGDLLNINAIQAGLGRLAAKHWFAASMQAQFTPSEIGKDTVTVTVRGPRRLFGTLFAGRVKPITVSYGGTVGGSVIVPVRVNDQTGHFLLVTNTDLSQISGPFAGSLGLTPQPMLVDGQPYFIDGQAASSVSLKQMALGGAPGIELRNVSLPVADLLALSKQFGRTVDGVLGADLLSRLAVEIDFPRRQITFWDHGHLSADERKAAGFAGAAEVPLESLYGSFPLPGATARIQNGTVTQFVPMIIGTGLGTSVLPATDAKILGMTPLPNPDDPATIMSRASHLNFGSLSLNAPLVQIADENQNATLGMNVLQSYRLLLDGPECTASFAPEVVASSADPQRTALAVPFLFDSLMLPNPVIQVSVNGHPPLPFLLDTGCTPALLLDRQAARALGVTATDASGNKMNSSIPTELGTVSDIVLQGQTAADNVHVSLEQAIIVDLSTVRDTMIGTHIAGVIGAGFLKDVVVHFDFPARMLTFYLNPKNAPESSGGVTLPLSESITEDEFFATLSAKGPESVRLLVDTGSNQTSVPYQVREFLRPEAAAINGEWMLGSMRMGQDLLLPDFPFDGMPEGSLGIAAEPTSDSPEHWFPGTLGMDLLSRLSVTLDVPHMRLLLGPPSANIPAVHRGWVGICLAQDGKDFKITQVFPESPASRAGLKAGDIMMAIDGHSAKSLTLYNARSLTYGQAGTLADFTIRRGEDTPQTFHFRRADVNSDPPSPLNGIYGRQEAANPFVIDTVVPGCPAARSGLAAGDTITKINGLATQSLTTDQWQTILLETRLTLVVTQGGKSRTVFLVNAPSDLKNSHPPTGKIADSGQEN